MVAYAPEKPLSGTFVEVTCYAVRRPGPSSKECIVSGLSEAVRLKGEQVHLRGRSKSLKQKRFVRSAIKRRVRGSFAFQFVVFERKTKTSEPITMHRQRRV